MTRGAACCSKMFVLSPLTRAEAVITGPLSSPNRTSKRRRLTRPSTMSIPAPSTIRRSGISSISKAGKEMLPGPVASSAAALISLPRVVI